MPKTLLQQHDEFVHQPNDQEFDTGLFWLAVELARKNSALLICLLFCSDVPESDLCGSAHVFAGTINLKNTNAGDPPVLCSKVSVTGQLIESSELENGSAARILSPCPPGWYIVLIRSEIKTCAQKFYCE